MTKLMTLGDPGARQLLNKTEKLSNPRWPENAEPGMVAVNEPDWDGVSVSVPLVMTLPANPDENATLVTFERLSDALYCPVPPEQPGAVIFRSSPELITGTPLA